MRNNINQAKLNRIKILETEYDDYLTKQKIALMRPECHVHNHIVLLDSLVLYFVEECQSTFV